MKEQEINRRREEQGDKSSADNLTSTFYLLTSSVQHLTSKLYLLITLFIVTSCTQNLDNYGPQNGEGSVPVAPKERTIIINEGNFMFGNGSVSVINNLNGSVSNNAFNVVNGNPLGDVPQSMIIHDSLAYIVVNNSGKIEVVDKADFTSVKTITGFASPRQMAIVNQNPLMAWVTDLYANKIWEVDLEQGAITNSFVLDGWNENILIHNLNVFILNKKDSVIYVLDVASGTKKHTYNLGAGIVDFRQWSDNELMVLAKEGMYKIDMLSNLVDTVLTFPVPRTPLRMAADTTENIVYFLESDVFKVDLKENQPTLELFLSKSLGSNLYGLEVNSQNGFVYVTDAKDYVQQGSVIVLDLSGNQIGYFTVGVNPQFIVFD